MATLTDSAIEPDPLCAAVADPSMGAVLLFHGVTRGHFEGREVVELAYEAYRPMALAEMSAIETEVGARWPGARCEMVHRMGVVPLGETSVVIAVATPHRAQCYEASRYAIDALKSRVPIWKKEIYCDGSAWKANTPV